MFTDIKGLGNVGIKTKLISRALGNVGIKTKPLSSRSLYSTLSRPKPAISKTHKDHGDRYYVEKGSGGGGGGKVQSAFFFFFWMVVATLAGL